jgi:hypothetical protein
VLGNASYASSVVSAVTLDPYAGPPYNRLDDPEGWTDEEIELEVAALTAAGANLSYLDVTRDAGVETMTYLDEVFTLLASDKLLPKNQFERRVDPLLAPFMSEVLGVVLVETRL